MAHRHGNTRRLGSRLNSDEYCRRNDKGQAAFPQPDLMYRLELNCSWWWW